MRIWFGIFTAAICGCSNAGPAGDRAATDTNEKLPAIDRLSAIAGAEGAVGITFEGRPGPVPVHWGLIEWLDVTGQVMNQGKFTSGAYSRFGPSAHVSFIEQSASAFSGWATYLASALGAAPARVRVTFENQEEEFGSPFESEVSTGEPQLREVNEACDPFEVLSICPESSLCDVRDPGVGELPTCQERPTTCPLELPTLADVYEGSNAGSGDDTQSSCTSSRGNIGTEQGHVFVAPATAAYRFVAESVDENAALTLFVRRYCEYARLGDSELACGHATETADARPTVELELTEGDTVYVFVEAWWAYGGRYRLSVETQ